MIVKLVKDANVLIPNTSHKNFTCGNEVIKKDTILEGSEKQIKGKRRGEDFVYKVFVTNKNQIIFLNTIQPMNKTEVTFGADSKVDKTIIKIPEKEKLFSKRKIVFIITGAALGCSISLYKKQSAKQIFLYTSIAAAAGLALSVLLPQKSKEIQIIK